MFVLFQIRSTGDCSIETTSHGEKMDFSLPVKRYDTDGMFTSPPAAPSPPNATNLAPRHGGGAGESGQSSKLDLLFARPGVLRHNGGTSNSTTTTTRLQGLFSSSSSAFATSHPALPAATAGATGRQSTSSSASDLCHNSQRSPVIVNSHGSTLNQRDCSNHNNHAAREQSSNPALSTVSRSNTGGVAIVQSNNQTMPTNMRPTSGVGSALGNGTAATRPQLARHSHTGLRSPPSYDTLRYLQGSSPRVGQRMSLKPATSLHHHHHQQPVAAHQIHHQRPLKFAPMKPPPPPPHRTEPPRQIRDYVIHANSSVAVGGGGPSTSNSAGGGGGGGGGNAGCRMSGTHDPDTLAQISELAKITRASIPMSPLEDEVGQQQLLYTASNFDCDCRDLVVIVIDG